MIITELPSTDRSLPVSPFRLVDISSANLLPAIDAPQAEQTNSEELGISPSVIFLASTSPYKREYLVEAMQMLLPTSDIPIIALPVNEMVTTDTKEAALSKANNAFIHLYSNNVPNIHDSLVVAIDVLNGIPQLEHSGYSLQFRGQPHTEEGVFRTFRTLYESAMVANLGYIPYAVESTTYIDCLQLEIGLSSTKRAVVFLSTDAIGELISTRFDRYVELSAEKGFDVTRLAAGIEIGTLYEMGVVHTENPYEEKEFERAYELALGKCDIELLKNVFR